MEGVGYVYTYTCQICQRQLEDPPKIQKTRSTNKLVGLDCGHVVHYRCLGQFFGREGDKSDGKIKCPDPNCKERYAGVPNTYKVALEPKSTLVKDLPAVKSLKSDFKLKLAEHKKHVMEGKTDEMTRLAEKLAQARARIAMLETNQRLPLGNIVNSPRSKK